MAIQRTGEIEELTARLAEIDAERVTIERRLRALQGTRDREATEAVRRFSALTFPGAPLRKQSAEDERVAFFLDLFHARRAK